LTPRAAVIVGAGTIHVRAYPSSVGASCTGAPVACRYVVAERQGAARYPTHGGL